MRMSVKSEEIKVVISASAGELKRELTAAEREMMKARGVMEQEGGKIAASSKVWSQYRSRTASELQKTLGEVERTQAKIDKLLEKGPAIRESERAAYEQKLIAQRYAPERASYLTEEAVKRGEQAHSLQGVLAAQQASVQELTGSLSALNAKVAETTQTEQQEAQAARDAASAEKEHTQATGGGTSAAGSFLAALKKRVAGLLQFSHAARSAGQSASGIGRSGQSAGGGIAKIGRTAVMALIGVRGLYAGLRKLVSATANAAAHNRTLANSLGQIKGNLSVMFQSIFQAALPALQKLASFLAMVTSYVAQFTAMLFGVKWKTAVDGAKAASSGIGGVADNAREASKAIHQMGIDELNILDREDDSDASGGGGGGGGIPAIYKEEDGPKFEWLDRLKEKLMPLIEKVKAALEKIREMWEALKEAFLSAWSKYAEPILNTIIGILGNIVDTIGNIAAKIREAAEQFAESIFSHVLATILNVLTSIRAVTAAIKEWSESTTFFETLGEAINSFTGLMETVSASFATAVQNHAQNLVTIWMGALENIIKFVGIVASKVEEAWKNGGNGDTIFDHVLKTIENIGTAISSVAAAWAAWAADTTFFNTLTETVSQITGLVETITGILAISAAKNAGKSISTWMGAGENIVGAAGNVAEKLDESLQTEDRGIKIMDSLYQAEQNVGAVVEAGTGAIEEWTETTTVFDPLMQAVSDLFGGVGDLTETVKNFLIPLLRDVIGPLLTAGSGVLLMAIGVIGSIVGVINAAVAQISWLGNVIQAFGHYFETLFSDGIRGIKKNADAASAGFKADMAAANAQYQKDNNEAWEDITNGYNNFQTGDQMFTAGMSAALLNLIGMNTTADSLLAPYRGQGKVDLDTFYAEDDALAAYEAGIAAQKATIKDSAAAAVREGAAEGVGEGVAEGFDRPGAGGPRRKIRVAVGDSVSEGLTDGIDDGTGDVMSIEGYLPSISFDANTEPLISGVDSALSSLPTEHTITVNFKMGSMPSFPKPGLAAGGGIIHAARGGIIPRLASGGSLGMGGQLFIAREAGPELVAGIGGGRTAVMNNDQIVKSVSDGVYKAVREAMASGSFDVNVVSRLICDNREIAKAAEKGRASMGRQIGSRAFA